MPSTGVAAVLPGFEGRFNIIWISQRATLVIFNMTEEGDGEFGCKLSTVEFVTGKEWKRRLKVVVVGKLGNVALVINYFHFIIS